MMDDRPEAPDVLDMERQALAAPVAADHPRAGLWPIFLLLIVLALGLMASPWIGRHLGFQVP